MINFEQNTAPEITRGIAKRLRAVRKRRRITQEKLSVFYNGISVGTLARYDRYTTAFEYADEWLADGFSISPFSLPLEKGIFKSEIDPFEGLFGVFADSLPDGWGRLLVDRLMRRNGSDPQRIGNLDRLAIVGDSGMGALTYKPQIEMAEEYGDLSLDEIAYECVIA